MRRKLLIVSIASLYMLIAVVITDAGEKRDRIIRTDISLEKLESNSERTSCQMFKTDPNMQGFASTGDYMNGDAEVSYFDPADPVYGGCGESSPYPFRITDLSFKLWDVYPDDSHWPVVIDIVIYDLLNPTDLCAGPAMPGNELYKYTISCDKETYSINYDINLTTVNLPNPPCVNGPFFIGLRYNDPEHNPGEFPGIAHESYNPEPIECEAWFFRDGNWIEWHTYWDEVHPPKHPDFVVSGETVADNCDIEWPNHKMHFPQLPDEDGWGITSSYNRILVDDWQCSESGPVRDLHFWGKWIFGVEGTIANFDISIYADIPADPPSVPFSRPGQLLWQFSANDYTETRFARTSPGGWFSPISGEALVDVQQDYFQYDIFFDDPQTWFEQVEGTIYWVQIACEWSVTGEWGWMSSLDHWNDNAVYWNKYDDEWIELFEPDSNNPLDLAFVITADANAVYEGACCYPEPTGSGDMLCTITSREDCEDNLLGTYRGHMTSCQPLEACCLPNGDCVMADPICCETVLLGAPMGVGTSCTALEACCFDDGSCQNLDPLCCVDIGGKPQGQGSDCATTTCDAPPKNWYQAPERSDKVLSVNATLESNITGGIPLLSYVLADDFLCTKTEPITEIHIWGSWLADMYKPYGPEDVIFHISIHSDIPAGELAQHSMPGPLLIDWFIGPEEFTYKQTDMTGIMMGWLDPPETWLPGGYNFEVEYIFRFDETNWFIQQGTEQTPVIYWLDVQAIVPEGSDTQFGWKTSENHWNDNAVYFEGEDINQQLPWQELVYPPDHPFAPADIDLAFMIGGPCDCQPGEADGVATEINILDIVHLVNYKYKGDVDPIPYALCSGDVNCNCTVDILDIVYLINFKYKGGPAPCSCYDFLNNCGIPLR